MLPVMSSSCRTHDVSNSTYAGSNLIVGFVSEDGTPVVNQVSTGASAIFPQGLVHYQQNLDCYQATYTISYNSEDPGTQVRSMANPTAYPSLTGSARHAHLLQAGHRL